jgi:hypothetical protein
LVPQVVTIGDNERVVHVVGMPFHHSYCAPRLETLLLERFAWRGLVVRRVELRGSMASLLAEFDTKVRIHRPTFVVLQAGNDDLYHQRAVTFDFGVYQAPTDEIVKKLRGDGAQVILCSVVPFDNDSTPGRLFGPVAGLQTWVEAARQIAARHRAVFVDQFTEAVGWPMIGNDSKSKFWYDPQGHEKSWKLFTKQVRFEPAGSEARINVGTGRTECRGATVSELNVRPDRLTLALQNEAGAGAVLVKLAGLERGNYRIFVDEKPLAVKSAEELAAGLDVGAGLKTRAATREFQEELRRGHAAVVQAADIAGYRLPSWVRLADFNQQKQAALRQALDAVATHDNAIRALTVPRALALRILRSENR